jgi:hypothetical protein
LESVPRTLAIAAALALPLCWSGLAAGSPYAPTGAAGLPGSWTLVSTGGIQSPVGEIGLARNPTGGLHVAWVRRTGGNSYDLVHTSIDSAAGRIGVSTPIVTGWAGLGGVALYHNGSELRAIFPGIRTTVTGDANFGLNQAVGRSGGASWLTSGSAMYRDQFAYARTAAAVQGPDPDGLQAWDGADGIGVHVGHDPNSPFRLGYGVPGCCNHGVNIARDQPTGQTMLAWCTMNDAPNGIWAQGVDPATGAPIGRPMLMPGSVDTSGRRICDAGQRVPLVARPGGGGFWIVAKNGAENAVLIWRVGGTGTFRFASGAGSYRRVGLAVAPDGRLWGAWSTFRDAARVHFRRSNRTVTVFGAPVSTAGPRGAVETQVIDLSAGPAKLDALVTYSAVAGTSLQHTQARPGLTLTAQGGRTLRFRVTDAGDPVRGATVRVGGRSLSTGASGRVSVDLRPGRFTARASKAGYVGAAARVRSR